MPTHLEWSIETEDGLCPKCGGITQSVGVLEMKPIEMDAEPFSGYLENTVEPEDEISGHYCPRCNKLSALYFNAAK